MSEAVAVYVVDRVLDMAGDSGTVIAVPLPDVLRIYFERRRESLIVELRALDRVLGLPQTIPIRNR